MQFTFVLLIIGIIQISSLFSEFQWTVPDNWLLSLVFMWSISMFIYAKLLCMGDHFHEIHYRFILFAIRSKLWIYGLNTLNILDKFSNETIEKCKSLESLFFLVQFSIPLQLYLSLFLSSFLSFSHIMVPNFLNKSRFKMRFKHYINLYHIQEYTNNLS